MKSGRLVAGENGLSNEIRYVSVYDNIPTELDAKIQVFEGEDVYKRQHQKLTHAYDGVHRRADFMTDIGQEYRLCFCCMALILGYDPYPVSYTHLEIIIVMR